MEDLDYYYINIVRSRLGKLASERHADRFCEVAEIELVVTLNADVWVQFRDGAENYTVLCADDQYKATGPLPLTEEMENILSAVCEQTERWIS